MGYHLINGLLAQVWWLADHWPAVVVTLLGVWHCTACRRRHHRPWLIIFTVVSGSGAGFARDPTPYIMVFVAVCILAAVLLDRTNPDVLRFRALGGGMAYGVAALGGEAAFWMLTRMDVRAYTAAVAAYGDAAHMAGIARNGFYTMLTWGLWLIVPMGILGMIVQGMVTHPPLRAPLNTMIDRVRTWGYGTERTQLRVASPPPSNPQPQPATADTRLRGQGPAPSGTGTRRPPRAAAQ